MISVDLAVVTNMRVDIWDQESVQDYLQLDHRDNDEGAAVEIVAILGEERQRREERKR